MPLICVWLTTVFPGLNWPGSLLYVRKNGILCQQHLAVNICVKKFLMYNESLGLCNGFWLVRVLYSNTLRQCGHIWSLGNEQESSVIFQLMIMCHCCMNLFALCRQCVWHWVCSVLPQPSGFSPAAVTSRQSLSKRLRKIQKTSRESCHLYPLIKIPHQGKIYDLSQSGHLYGWDLASQWI